MGKVRTGRILNHLARLFPQLLWRWYARKARQLGLGRLYLILSFDCDTPEDIAAAEQLGAWLRDHGIKATYAVPGRQLEQGAAVYRRLAEMGADFINHGALPHAEWRENRYWSITFYHEMSPQEIIADIRRGHEIVEQIIGRPPTGFRAPHFGLFQERQQLALLHGTLKDLGYRYSTLAVPRFGFRHGPVWDVGGLYEVPLSGPYSSPLDVLDSWRYVVSPYQPVLKDEYASLFTQTVDRLLALGVPGVLNYYVDPAHVYKCGAFYRAMEYVVERQVPTLHYEELLDGICVES
jgi:hypothetical protein